MTRLCTLWLFLAAISVCGAIASESGLSRDQKERLIEAIGKKLTRKAYAFETDFAKWDQYVEKHRPEIDTAKSNEELAIALSKALEEFDLSHLGLFSPENLKLKRKGQRNGMGITIHPLEDGGGLISFVLAGSPAERCGLKKGDQIMSIDNEPLTDITQLAGEPGQVRHIKWLRNGSEMSCNIEYAPFNLSEPSSFRWLRDDVALIRIQSFQYKYYKAAKINRFFNEARKAKAIILDLRNNRGGLSFYSRHLASKLSPSKETFGYLANSRHEGSENPYRAIHPLPFSRAFQGQVIVLVDSLSASAADIVPAFVSESGRGIVIGQKTAGALQLARSFPLPYGYRLYLPIAEILTPLKNRLEHSGLTPDIELSLEQTIDDAAIFAEALRAIDKASD